MADNRIVHRVSLEGDADVKSRLKSVEDAMKRIEATNASGGKGGGFEGPLKNVSEAGGKLRQALAPVLGELNGAGGGLFGSLGGIFSGLASRITSPAGIIAALTAARIKLAQFGDETKRVDQRIKSLGGGSSGAEDLGRTARQLGISRESLQPGYENFLAAQRASQQDPRVSHPPGYEASETQSSANVINGGRPINGQLGTRRDFLAAQSALIYSTRLDKTDGDKAKEAVEQLTSSINKNRGLTGDDVSSFANVSPAAANRLARVVGPMVNRGFADSAQLVAYLDQQRTPLPADQVYKALAHDEPGVRIEAEKNRGIGDGFGSVRSAAGRLADSLGTSDNSDVVNVMDSVAKGIDATAGLIEKNSRGIQDSAKTGYDFARKAPPIIPGQAVVGTAVGAGVGILKGIGGDLLKSILDQIRPTFLGKALVAPGEIANGRDNAREKLTSAAETQSKAAGAQSKAAADLSKAAADLSKAAGGEKSSKNDGSEPTGKKAGENKTDENGVSKPVSMRGTVEDLTTHSGFHPDTQVSGDASRSRPQDIYDLNKIDHDQKIVGEYEGDAHNAFTKSIRDQLGLKTPEPQGERLYPGGPNRYRYEPVGGRQPAELGSYDDNMNFVPNKRQPYSRLRSRSYISDQPYNPAEDTFDTKGGGDNNPIYDFGQPQPLDFPTYTRQLREELPGVPLPRERPASADDDNLARLRREIRGYAEGGEVEGSGDTVDVKKRRSLSDDELFWQVPHDISFDQNTGGLIIDSLPRRPNESIFDVPIGRQVLERARAAYEAEASKGPTKPKYKSLFVGKFGEHADGGPISGPGTSRSDSIPAMLSDGEFVVNAGAARNHLGLLHAINGGRKIGLSHFAVGGPVGLLGNVGLPQVNTPDIANAGGASEALHHVTIAMPDGREVGGLRAPRDVIRALEREAITSVNTEIGRKPSWVRGR